MSANVSRWQTSPVCNLAQITCSTRSQILDPSMCAGHGSDQGYVSDFGFVAIPDNQPLLDTSLGDSNRDKDRVRPWIVVLRTGCKRRSKNPSVRRPSRSVAPD